MTYKTLMVHSRLQQANTNVLSAARELTNRFGAKVIGIAAFQPIPILFNEQYLPTEYMGEDQEHIDKIVNSSQAEFHAAFNGSDAEIEWRWAKIYGTVPDYISCECGVADLVITSGAGKNSSTPEIRGDIVMKVGRPVLIVPEEAAKLHLNHAVIAWKNSREARRAISDALPLLKLAKQVTLLQIGHKDEHEILAEHLIEIAMWLSSHHVFAELKFVVSNESGDAIQLNSVVQEIGADLVIGGAYGQSRLREWAFGGVTRDLMLKADYCTLLSH